MNSEKYKYLYPPIEPYRADLLPLRSGHEIYVEECGNPLGLPIMVVHGGPGAGCDADDRRFFDPNKWRIILFDQRGSGRSKPFGDLHANNTWALADDMKTILKRRGIDSTALLGGSWGSTLSAVYAISFPRTVSGMILRGIFLGEKDEVDYLYNGQVALFRPATWRRFASCVPPEERKAPLTYIYKQLLSPNPEIRKKFAYEMAFYEMSLLRLKPEPIEETDAVTKDFAFESMSLMEAHYFVNNCFMEPGYIIENAYQMPDVPITILQGEYDLVCPPISAYRLHKAVPHSRLKMILSGHSSSDPEMAKALVAEINAMFDRLTAKR